MNSPLIDSSSLGFAKREADKRGLGLIILEFAQVVLKKSLAEENRSKKNSARNT